VKYGAFVNIGTERDVLVHVSEISNEYVKEITDYVSNGDEVTLKLLSIGEDGKLQGTFILDNEVRAAWQEAKNERKKGGRRERGTKDVSGFADLDIREFMDGKVEKVVDAGAFVSVPSIAPGTWGWIHVSQIDSEDYVEKAADVLTQGQDLKVRVYKCEVETGNLVFSNKEFTGRARRGPRQQDGNEHLPAAMREALSAVTDDGPSNFPPPRGPRAPRRPRDDAAKEEETEEVVQDWQKEFDSWQSENAEEDNISFSFE